VDERRAPLRGLQDRFFPVRDLRFYCTHDLVLQWLTRAPPSVTAASTHGGKDDKKVCVFARHDFFGIDSLYTD
jgi:hypothetical protein